MIVDTTVQEEAIVHPVDSRLLEIGVQHSSLETPFNFEPVIPVAERCRSVLSHRIESTWLSRRPLIS